MNPDVVWVAAQGPLWSTGGDRGLYKTTDGGKTWTKILGGGEWTGVTDVALDPRNPDVLYAATWQRQRTVAALMGGGPESGIHSSTDGGATWEKLKKGLPEGAARQDRARHLARRTRTSSTPPSSRTGARAACSARPTAARRWEKRSETVSGATGPHYYQELYASPHAEGRIYLVDVRMQVSDDGGKTFRSMDEKTSTPTTTPSPSARTTPTTCSSAPTAGSTRASTWRRPGGSSRTCRSRSSTRWRWTTTSPSTTSTAAPRTTAPRAARRAPTAPTASATATGSSPSSPTATSRPPSPATPTSCTPSGSRGTWCASTARPASGSTSSPSPSRATPSSASTGTRRSWSARTRRSGSTTPPSACGAPTTAATAGARSRATSRGTRTA